MMFYGLEVEDHVGVGLAVVGLRHGLPEHQLDDRLPMFKLPHSFMKMI